MTVSFLYYFLSSCQLDIHKFDCYSTQCHYCMSLLVRVVEMRVLRGSRRCISLFNGVCPVRITEDGVDVRTAYQPNIRRCYKLYTRQKECYYL